MRAEADAFDVPAALIAQLDAAEQALAHAEDAKAIHGCRVGIKRARALARIGKTAAPGIAGIFNDRARGLMGAISDARDAAALAECALREARRTRGDAAQALIRIALAIARQEIAPFDRDAARADISDLRALARVWPAPSRPQVKKSLKRIVKRARRAFKKAYGRRVPDLRHAWRKREKDKLFAIQLAPAAWPAKYKLRERRARKLATALGLERELLLLLARIDVDPMIAGDPESAIAAHRHFLKAHAVRARKADRLARKLHRGGQ